MVSQNTHFVVPPPAFDGIPLGLLPALHARGNPSRPAITHEGETISWAELDARSTRRARRMQALGVGQDDFVTVGLPNSLEFYETSFAIWKLGATPNVVSPNLPAVELAAILDLVRPRLLVCPQAIGAAAIDAASLASQAMLAAGDRSHEALSANALPERVSTYWKAMTSGGSTGRPKVIVDHMPGRWHPTIGMLGQQPHSVVLNPGPLYHNAPFSMVHGALFVGSHVIDMRRFDALRALQLIEQHRVEWMNLVPTMMHRIWRLPAEQREAFDLSSLKIVFHMASACPPWLKEKWLQWLGPQRIWELYGGTERQGRTIISGEEWLAHPGSVGRVTADGNMRVLDEAGADCATGMVGEIFFLPATGRNSTYHYVGAQAKARGDWESIGDLGYLDAEGYLYLVDRRTDLVISGGANIYPAEVEAALDAHPEILSSAVIGLPDDDLGQRVHAIIQIDAAKVDAAKAGAGTSGGGGSGMEERIREFLATRLARYKIPRSMEFVATPLRDDAGKARRSALREQRLPASKT